ncbi:hypothetical protein [Sphaerisporangium dianthi]|uniref:Uncharacterized protein n=1 Tax=Sphaerisporangium dianthi TaxID=1436120 RepID=A0ABV9CHC4_9ACTN
MSTLRASRRMLWAVTRAPLLVEKTNATCDRSRMSCAAGGLGETPVIAVPTSTAVRWR